MSFVLYLAGLLVIGAVALLVALPLLRPAVSREQEVDEVEPEVVRWEKQKTDAYAAIKEAEFDWQMSKLTDDDYQALRQKYEQRALDALAQLDRLRALSAKTREIPPRSALPPFDKGGEGGFNEA